jgi:EF-P beta-lysylation protein EpmB
MIFGEGIVIMESLAITNVNRNKAMTPDSQFRWKAELAASFSCAEDLLEYLGLPLDACLGSGEAVRRFPFRVTAAFASRMKKGDPNDPLLLQVLPVAEELVEQAGYAADPVGDLRAIVVPGLLHKYHGRALLIASGACAIHCRYCFRREFPYADGQLNRSRLADVFESIARDASIAEVILSGGDPLVLDDGRLVALVDGIAAIPHVRRLRIHTRLPIVLPSRITADLVQILIGTRLKPVVVVHANHANEFDDGVGRALLALRSAGVALLNQSVLLKGVNDRVEALAGLSETLFDHGVLPYYLHVLDKANGTGHFDVPETTALALVEELRRCLPGYLVPRLVREVDGAAYKVSLFHANNLPCGPLCGTLAKTGLECLQHGQTHQE